MFQEGNFVAGTITSSSGVSTNTRLASKSNTSDTKYRALYRTAIVTDKIVQALWKILEENPEYYLDELAVEFVKKTSVYFPQFTCLCLQFTKL